MYTPSYFEMNDRQEINEVIEAYGFATLTSLHEGSLTATQLPLLLSEDKTELIGHFAKGNKQWTDIEDQQVLVVFQGPHCYISPSWYETQNTVPTWNYVTVQVAGKVKLLKEDDSRLWQSMVALTEKYEEPTSAYNLLDVDPSYISSLSKGVVGFTISIDKVEGKAKLSQNHPKERVERVVERLRNMNKSDEKAIARWMEKKMKVKK
ncbi:FMN-binding negative transcriptional regulator [Paenisporosarcina quisquiliarum]|uniref:FMN-binding negative transcriptional regulator n=1 Tax=Paenisporosarcina quisquiliarum TaxID=365346 RepID=A0A9X3LF76_9BACL|nr:FMN-binding negative transcriptional regulator [Paenisporosarcina quisquiliarum]